MHLTDPGRGAVIELRARINRGRIVAHFESLYGTEPIAAEALARLLAEIGDAAKARPERLWRLDLEREAAPDWYLQSDQLGYCCYVDRFGGDLAGVQSQIPYLQEIGVTYLHLLPFWNRPPDHSDGGFAVSDHETVDPSLGTNADLMALAEALEHADITLCSDLVLNHTADDHRWAVAAKAGDPAYREFYRVFPSRELPDRFETTVKQVFPETAPGNFTWTPELDGWVWTTFYPFQWDLNWENPAVLVEMVRIILHLANLGIGAFRLDSAPFLWKRLGTDCQNQPETHTVLQLIRAVMAIAAPGVLLKAEAVVATRELPAYFGLPAAPGQECHLAYQTSIMAASWAGLAHGDAALLRQVIAGLPPLEGAGSWLTYVRCHDDIGWQVLGQECDELGDLKGTLLTTAARFFTERREDAYARGVAFQSNGLMATNGTAASLVGIEAGLETGDARQVDAAIDRLMLLHGVAMSVGGLPVIYMGDELGQLNTELPPGEIDGRWLHRPVLDATAAATRLDSSTVAGRVFSRLSRLARIRRALPALRADQPLRMLESGAETLCCFTRGPNFVAAFNFSSTMVSLSSILGSFQRFRDLIEPDIFDGTHLGPWKFVWLVPPQ